MTWSWDLSLPENFVVNMQCCTMKYEMIRKRVEVSSLVVGEEFENDPILRSKWEDLWNLAEIGVTKEYGNFPNSTKMNKPQCNTSL